MARSGQDRSDRLSRLGAFARMYLRFENPDWPAHFGGLAIVQGGELVDRAGRVRLEAIASRLEVRLLCVPAMRQRLLFPGPLGGPPLWVDDRDFDIRRHLHVASVPAPGDNAALLDAAADLNQRLLDRAHPLWEIWFLTGLSDGRIGILLKLHHAMADGMAAVGLMTSLFDSVPDAADPPPLPWIPAVTPRRAEVMADNLRRAGAFTMRTLSELLHPRRLLGSLRTYALVASRAFGGRAARRTSLNARVRAGRRIGLLHIDRAAARRVAAVHGGTTNDVVLTLWALGIRRLLVGRNEEISGLELAVGQPVSLRRRTDSLRVDNQVGTIVVMLPVDEDQPLRLLDRIIAMSRRTKSHRRRPAAIAGALAGLATTPLGRYLFTNQRATHVLVTNVPGPRAPVYLFGARLLDVVPIIQLMGNIGLTLCAFGYARRITLVVTADEAAFPDLEVLMNGMRHGWDVLCDGSPQVEPTAAA